MSRLQKKVFFVCLGFFLFSLWPLQSFAIDRWIKVRLFSNYQIKDLELDSSFAEVKTLSQKKIIEQATLTSDHSIRLKLEDSKIRIALQTSRVVDQLEITPPIGSYVRIRVGSTLDRKYFGKISIRSSKNSLILTEELTLENYVRGVVEAEMPNVFSIEALKAQAILIRTYVLSHLDRHAKEGFHVCDSTHCQFYAGRNLNYRSHEEAARATQGIILAYQFQPIEALYHSSCGGHTSPNQKVFGGRSLPYLQGVSDNKYCAKSPQARWENSIALPLLNEILKKDSELNLRGGLTDIRTLDAEKKGRAFQLVLEGKTQKTVSAYEFVNLIGRYLGWSTLKSTWFEVKIKNGKAYFKGRGLGHGVGLCQWGAEGMAKAGKKFDQILFHYFPGTHLIQK